MALDTDFTSPTYDAYADIATMDAIISAQVIVGGGTDGGWSNLDVASKEVMIKASTAFIDTLDWYGERNELIVEPYRTQPRSGLYYPDNSIVPDDVIQQPITGTMGCWIIATMNSNADSTTNASGIKKKKVGDVEIEYLTSDKSGVILTDVEKCPASHLPDGWYRSTLVLGGIGSVGLSRFP